MHLIGSARLSELIGAATETAPINRTRAPSGPVEVPVPTQPQERPHGGISLLAELQRSWRGFRRVGLAR